MRDGVHRSGAPEAGTEKYDVSVGPTVGLLRYGCGLPHYRLARLQESLGVPLPESTQWELMLPVVDAAEPAFKELIRQAAQASVVYLDDTWMRIRELRSKGGGGIDPKRTGTFTSAVVAEIGAFTAVTFFTGWKHAGENLSEVLQHRVAGLEPPIQMCDALSRNRSRKFTIAFQTLLANCIVHARREFLDVREAFPAECGHVVEQLGEIYRFDAEAKERGLSPSERLIHHQTHSGPVMAELQHWMAEILVKKRTEPNDGLGRAIAYMQNHWDALTLFLRVPGAPLDNNWCYAARGITPINSISYPVTGAGGAVSFAAAGGAAGVIHSTTSAYNAAGGPAGFGSVSTMGLIPSTGGASTSQTHFGGVIMDKSGNGATMTGPIADFKVNGVSHTQLGATTSAVGLIGSVLENGMATIPPPSGNSEIAFGLTLTEDDTAAMIGRQEIGGELLAGSVMALYPLATHSEVIDCGAAGCNASQMTLGFFGSGNGDTYAFIVRQEISSVPETTKTALLGLGLFGLLATWQRTRRTR